MKKVKYVCKRCSHRFVAEIFEPGEKEERKAQSWGPVTCPLCKSIDVVRD